jgi:ankyrin repeat protein
MGEKKQRAPRSDTKLLQPCLDGNLAVVRERIAAGANVNAGRKDKRPPLETAACCGHLEVVREFISVGANVNQIAKVNFEVFPGSALVGAIKQKHFDVAQELVRAGASVTLETHPGCNAASEAAFNAMSLYWSKNSSWKWVVQTLEELGEKRPEHSTFDAWFRFLKQAVAAGAKVNDYCLWKACQLGCAEVALYLISIGVNVNVMPHRRSALQTAIEADLDEVSLALIAAKCDPNLTGEFGDSPLKLALTKEKHTIIRALLEAGATPVTKVVHQGPPHS